MNEALKTVFEEFRNISFESIPQRCSVGLVEDKIKIRYLNRWYLVSHNDVSYLTPSIHPTSLTKGNFNPSCSPFSKGDGGISKWGGGAEVDPDRKAQVSDRDKTIILHYLSLSKGTPASGKLIDFREIPGGNMYYSVFEKRVYEPFLKVFGERPALFVEAATSLGGEGIDFGDSAFKFMVLPRIPINFILHRGDEDFPPACKVLFDSNISDHLPTEDIAIVCEYLVQVLRKCRRTA